jgi:hypothetical protein
MAFAWTAAALIATAALFASDQPRSRPPSEILGLWRGTSTCTDRVAAPACNDETVEYEFTPGPKPGTVHWKPYKIVDGQRDLMGELDLAYDASERCWLAEFKSPRVQIVWCLAVTGTHINGSGWLLPGKQKVRKVDVDKA